MYQLYCSINYLINIEYNLFTLKSKDNLTFFTMYENKLSSLPTVGKVIVKEKGKEWSTDNLFYNKNSPGPIIQLWEAFSTKPTWKFVFFSEIPIQKRILKHNKICIDNLSPLEFEKLIEMGKDKFPQLGDNFTKKNLAKFVNSIEFLFQPQEMLVANVHRCLSEVYGETFTDVEWLLKNLKYSPSNSEFTLSRKQIATVLDVFSFKQKKKKDAMRFPEFERDYKSQFKQLLEMLKTKNGSDCFEIGARFCTASIFNLKEKIFKDDSINRSHYDVSYLSSLQPSSKNLQDVFLITGETGIGKSKFVQKIAEACFKDQDFVSPIFYIDLAYWTKAQKSKITINEFSEYIFATISAENLAKEEDTSDFIERIRAYLKLFPTVIIFDGMEKYYGDYNVLRKLFLNLATTGHIVFVTGRSSEIQRLLISPENIISNHFKILTLHELTNMQVREILKKSKKTKHSVLDGLKRFTFKSGEHSEISFKHPMVLQTIISQNLFDKPYNYFQFIHTRIQSRLRSFFKGFSSKKSKQKLPDFSIFEQIFFKLQSKLAVHALKNERVIPNKEFEGAFTDALANTDQEAMKTILSSLYTNCKNLTTIYQNMEEYIFPDSIYFDFFVLSEIKDLHEKKDEGLLSDILKFIMNNTAKFKSLAFQLFNSFSEGFLKQDATILELTDKISQENSDLNAIEHISTAWDKSIVQTEDGSITFLDMSNLSIKIIPEWVFQRTKIEHLILDNNELIEVPAEIGKLRNLKVLSLSNNKLQELPDQIWKLNLRVLYLDKNKFTKIPSEIKDLAQLCFLNLATNKLGIFPEEICNLQSLTTLNLSDNLLQTLPNTFSNLSKLQILLIGNNPFSKLSKQIFKINTLTNLELSAIGLQELPPEIGNLEQLRILEMQNNSIKYLPVEFRNLIHLKQLNISSNPLYTLTFQIFKLKKLEVLSLRRILLKELNPKIGHLTHLVYFSLQQNKLKQLPEEIQMLSKLATLDLQNNRLSKFPTEITELKNLNNLVLKNNRLDALPDSIKNIKQLINFHLDHNQLQQLPNSFTQLTKLELLFLEANLISSLPEGFGNLKELKYLSLQNNHLGKLPNDIGKLENLVLLLLRNNQISEIPNSFYDLHNLSSLSLRQNQLTQLKGKIGKLTNLILIDLSENRLKKVPDELGKLINLKSLQLQNNQLNKIPKSLLSLPELYVLGLHKNQIKQLPDNFSEKSNLQELYLNHNQITNFPEELPNLINLKHLEFHNNLLKKIPKSIEKFTKLLSLALHSNKIIRIPAQLGNLTNLQSLSLANNQLKVIPNEIGKLNNLSELNLSNNQLQSLPEDLKNLQKLTRVELNENQLITLPQSISYLSKLNLLSAHNNKLTKIATNFTKLVNLNWLNLQSNQLAELPIDFSNLIALIYLNVKENQLTTLPESLSSLINLKFFDFSDNSIRFLPNNVRVWLVNVSKRGEVIASKVSRSSI